MERVDLGCRPSFVSVGKLWESGELESLHKSRFVVFISLCFLWGYGSAQSLLTAPKGNDLQNVDQPALGAENKEVPKRSPANQPAATLAPVEVRGSDSTESRRQSMAAKIIVDRDDIELFGDATMGELLKRLPGVTVSGRPGRGGAPRMRGLGNGYTQILIDGERVPRGFSIDDLSPEQIERIEILRAPTAETGARAIAGTINFITRGGYAKHTNSLNTNVGLENGRVSPGAAWSLNDKVGDLIYNLSVAAQRTERSNDRVIETSTEDLTTGGMRQQVESVSSPGTRENLHANARLQWRGAGGNSLTLTPMLSATQNTGNSSSLLTTSSVNFPDSGAYDRSEGSVNNRFSSARLGGIWIYRVPEAGTLRVGAHASQSLWDNNSDRKTHV